MTGPRVVRTRADLRAAVGDGSIALVPTMGALHDGHVQLMKHARPLAETLVASVFVNPTQFAPGEDLDSYPRTFEEDVERCAEAGVDVIFAPTVDVMYPDGLDAGVSVDPGPLGQILEGAARPTHFRGVLTVVAKLFGLVRPDLAVFGEKDYQQLTLIRLMARELCLGVEIVGCPTVREADGLAMSSRNRYLDDDERQLAGAISAALRAGAAAGPEGADAVLAAARAVLDEHGIVPDYLVLTDPDLGDPVPGQEARLLVAARVGSPRLLDNIPVTLGGL
ncbi:pantoate--beta-alanine ligase [Aeromicrobium phragmitis]|uniref:Pantothenate synthetase n=1 Tax=Aeromicrobium phragmitis TaxID=2478914 RepID=A0A3L8PLK3_9ACTN|nr:pantoate--beta-alanine ligase [Aeromicrobium phragmitis]RLV56286.1 pantoate--beta-alanine ligase [Aeromicrobium phragmitis]